MSAALRVRVLLSKAARIDGLSASGTLAKVRREIVAEVPALLDTHDDLLAACVAAERVLVAVMSWAGPSAAASDALEELRRTIAKAKGGAS